MEALVNSTIGLAISLKASYPVWIKGQIAPKYIGIGIDYGSAKRLTSENGSFDYECVSVSTAAKLQNSARPNGGIVIKEKCSLSIDLRKEFSKQGHLNIGSHCIPIRGTKEVIFDYNLGIRT